MCVSRGSSSSASCRQRSPWRCSQLAPAATASTMGTSGDAARGRSAVTQLRCDSLSSWRAAASKHQPPGRGPPNSQRRRQPHDTLCLAWLVRPHDASALAPMHCSQPRHPAVSSCSVVLSPHVLLRTLESSSFAHAIELTTPDRCRWPRRRARSAVSSCARCIARAFTCTALLSRSHAVCVKAILRCLSYVDRKYFIIVLPPGGGHKCCQQPGRDTGAK